MHHTVVLFHHKINILNQLSIYHKINVLNQSSIYFCSL